MVALRMASGLRPSRSIGIIETRGTDETSRIVFYDGELNEVAQLPLRYANLGDVFHNPLVYQAVFCYSPRKV